MDVSVSSGLERSSPQLAALTEPIVLLSTGGSLRAQGSAKALRYTDRTSTLTGSAEALRYTDPGPTLLLHVPLSKIP